jgi:hypothetical protein
MEYGQTGDVKFAALYSISCAMVPEFWYSSLKMIVWVGNRKGFLSFCSVGVLRSQELSNLFDHEVPAKC